MSFELIDDFRSIVLQKRVLIDLRAPIEFNRGSFPNSFNLPLLNDKERELIGIRYKEAGNKEAVKLGRELLDGEPKEKRVKAWVEFIKEHPKAYLFCFRGGQRSKIAQEWIKEAGFTIPRLKGGYKAFRNFLIREGERISKEQETIIIGGRTGSGKTLLLSQIDQSIDLEKIAKHRGSSFGRRLSLQPTQINFENTLSYELIEHEAKGFKRLIIEDEGKHIGRLYFPKEIYQNFQNSKLILLEEPIEKRVENIFKEYVTDALREYESIYKEDAKKIWFEDVLKGLDRIKKRLGSKRYKEILQMVKGVSKLSDHKEWIELLLKWYYDPMYDYQIKNKKMPIVFRGDKEEILGYLEG
jgi:tRNA 2-selenouridine synthase